jgi:PhoPQ-activated pathogenicity-related protein
MVRRLTSLTLLGILVLFALSSAPQHTPARADHAQTALDRYVAVPDPSFGWKVLKELPADGATATLIEMTSQRWLTEQDVEQPLWTHWLTIVRGGPEPPASAASSGGISPRGNDIALLFITGGSNDRQPPSRPPAWLVETARDTGTVTAELRLVPNQPVVFKDDPLRKQRSEDDFIAYTWDRFLRTGDERWPARLPMTKSAVRAMDVVSAFTASPQGGGTKVTRFVVSGASKRGWTTWTTAAVDRRVVAIAPAVIDMLNVEPSFVHHWRAYGAWSDAVKDYVQHGIMNWMGTPEFRALMRIEEPYEYRDRLTLPKLILNAAGDQFFLPDSSRFYFDALRGEKHLRYVPNTSHSLDKSDATETLEAFYTAIVRGEPRPEMRWTFEPDGSIKVVAKRRPDDIRVWQASNPAGRNFRQDVIGPAYKATPVSTVSTARAGGAPAETSLRLVGPNTWIAHVPGPTAGWTAFFVELSYTGGGKYPLKVTTGVRVLPDTLPYPPPTRRATPAASKSRAGAAGESGPPPRGAAAPASKSRGRRRCRGTTSRFARLR